MDQISGTEVLCSNITNSVLTVGLPELTEDVWVCLCVAGVLVWSNIYSSIYSISCPEPGRVCDSVFEVSGISYLHVFMQEVSRSSVSELCL